MPHHDIRDLPHRVTSHLPKQAQEIFLTAFNHAFEEYQHDKAGAFPAAWSAVERDDEKLETGQWRKKASG
jgi:cation transport regulator